MNQLENLSIQSPTCCFLTPRQHLAGLGRSRKAITVSMLARASTSRVLPRRLRSIVSISSNCLRLLVIASSARTCSLEGIVIFGRMRAANSASITASMASVLACLPIARAKSLACLGLITAMGKLASVQAIRSGCSRPPVYSQVIRVGLSFLTCFLTLQQHLRAWVA
jgi:hypothetical protein